MEKTKISKQDKNLIIITLIIGFVGNFFLDSAMDIALLCMYMYILHKYIGTTKNIREYDSYEFRDKSKFDKGKRLFVILVDIYILIRIILMILKPENLYSFSEMLLITMIYVPYEKYLEKKYVIQTDIPKEKKQVVLIRKKILSSILMVSFVLFSIFTFNTVRKLDKQDYAKYGTHEYKLSKINDKRKIEIEVGSHYMMSEESDGNSKYFDKFLEDAKPVMKKQIFRSYVFGSMIFMILLCFSETYPRDEKVISIGVNIFLVGLLLCSIFYFNVDTWDDEMKLSSYFHEYMNR